MSDYLALVSQSGQVNTPPGSYRTIKEWIAHGLVREESSVLEIGCTTGFCSIEIARYAGATCHGIDLHGPSIETARTHIDPYVADQVTFDVGDAGALPYREPRFSHVIIGGHLPFVPPLMRRPHIEEAIRVIRPWGMIMTALYYYREPPPLSLIESFNKEMGTHLSASGDQGYWSRLFEGLPVTLEHESTYDLQSIDSAQLETYLQSVKPDTRDDWQRRLELFSENGKYLSYFVRVYRRLPSEGAMMQSPRGGIYRSTLRTSTSY